jgi:hypothetical protein
MTHGKVPATTEFKRDNCKKTGVSTGVVNIPGLTTMFNTDRQFVLRVIVSPGLTVRTSGFGFEQSTKPLTDAE